MPIGLTEAESRPFLPGRHPDHLVKAAMKPLATIHVIPDLPAPLVPLWGLSYNLWWSWSTEVLQLFSDIGPEAWFESGRNPLRFLASLSPERLAAAEADDELVSRIARLTSEFEEYVSRGTWFDETHGENGLRIAYFSLEFGIARSLPIYSGGLGVLAGDHLKSASNLGLPLVGVGLLYRQGYFRQTLNPDGWQLETYPENDFDRMPVQQVLDSSGNALTVEVPYPHGAVAARIWRADVGRVPLFLLDADLERNAPSDRDITAVLYGGDREMRIRQEMLLGIGGFRALQALGTHPGICHMNEGHSAFQALERIRSMMVEQGFDFEGVREATVAGNVFTIHTPVAAGNDWFPPDLVESWLGAYRQDLDLTREQFLGLGRVDPGDQDSDFCMTVLALRLSAQANGVSRLHGEVARSMWAHLWPDLAPSEGTDHGDHQRGAQPVLGVAADGRAARPRSRGCLALLPRRGNADGGGAPCSRRGPVADPRSPPAAPARLRPPPPAQPVPAPGHPPRQGGAIP